MSDTGLDPKMDKDAIVDQSPQVDECPSQESFCQEQQREETASSPRSHTEQEQTQNVNSVGDNIKLDDDSKVEILPSIEELPSKSLTSPSTNSGSLNNDVSVAATNAIQEANDEIARLLLDNRITAHDSSKLQSVLRENAVLKDKITKLKTLLSRSAKVSKETKLDLEQHKRLLDVAKKEVERLNVRIEDLASRPTHMDLLADFETNFDRALMNLHSENISPVETVRQSVGQATEQNKDEENVYNMLMTELNQAKARVEHMENMNNALKKRTVQLERQNEKLIQDRESGKKHFFNINLDPSYIQLMQNSHYFLISQP
jgi:chromosome segregation ATPase